jgi:hypothetical protein
LNDEIYEWKTVCYGMPGAPAYYQRKMRKMLNSSNILAKSSNFMDDILAAFKTEDEALEFTIELLEVCNDNKVKLNMTKFEPFSTRIVALGLLITKKGISLDPNKVYNIRMWKRPNSMKTLSQLVELLIYFLNHIKNLSFNLQTLKVSTDKLKIRNFKWTDEMEREFLNIASKIEERILLHFPN